MYIYAFFHTYMDIYGQMYIFLYVVNISFRFVSPNFLTKFRRTKGNKALAKRNFGEISFRDEAEIVNFGEIILTHSSHLPPSYRI
jgi:hypothetical protein